MSFDRRIKNDINVRISQGAIILSVLTRAEYPSRSTRMCQVNVYCVLVLVAVIRESVLANRIFFFSNKGKVKYVGQSSKNVY